MADGEVKRDQLFPKKKTKMFFLVIRQSKKKLTKNELLLNFC